MNELNPFCKLGQGSQLNKGRQEWAENYKIAVLWIFDAYASKIHRRVWGQSKK
jgi:hypothetical protein